jgi:hypothetical protein
MCEMGQECSVVIAQGLLLQVVSPGGRTLLAEAQTCPKGAMIQKGPVMQVERKILAHIFLFSCG